MTINTDSIEEAEGRIKGYIKKTEILKGGILNDLCGCKVHLKLENFQKTGSFKLRGATNRLLSLSTDEKEKGIVTPSTGNHGLAVAYIASLLNLNCTIVLPKNAKRSKIDAIRRYNVKCELFGDTYDDAFQRAGELRKVNDLIMINSFEDEDLIVGSGTLAKEVVDELSNINTILVPVGSGNLLAGTIVALKDRNIKVVGVEPEGAAAMLASMKNGRPTTISRLDTIADGLVAKHPGIKSFNIIKEVLKKEDIVTVSDNEIVSTLLLLLERKKILVEPSGAAGFAALLYHKVPVKEDDNVAVLITGGNIELSDLAYIIEKRASGEGRRAAISLVVKDMPQIVQNIMDILAKYGLILEYICADRYTRVAPIGSCELRINVIATLRDSIEKSVKELRDKGYRVTISY